MADCIHHDVDDFGLYFRAGSLKALEEVFELVLLEVVGVAADEF